jgi:uncharacterized membrane protein YvlD (DUF360 family)
MRTQKPKRETDENLAQIVTGHGPCTYLLLSFLIFILIYPYCKNTHVVSRVIPSLLFSLILIEGIYVTSRTRQALIIGIVLSIINLVLLSFGQTTNLPIFFRLAGAIYILFLINTIGAVLRYLLIRGPVNADKLHGALAGYVMLAFLWAFLYSLLESFVPGSFDIAHLEQHEPSAFYPLLYFSFTVLTTVGFGDITPVTDQARSLVMVEQMAGVFFVAVLIARLAGLYPQTPE